MNFPARADDFKTALRMLPAAGVLGVWIALMPADGGFFPRDWGPAGLVLCGLLLATVVGSGRILPRGRSARVALLSLVALSVFALLSILWTETPGTAWATANQLLTVVLGVWTLSLLPWTAARAELCMAVYAVGAAAALGGALATAAGSENLSALFIEDRWASPIGYPNGLGNFGFFAALPVLAMSAAAGRHVALKAAGLGLATFLSGCALLAQSRGSILALLVAVPVLVALSPLRWRVVARVAVVAGALALVHDQLFALLDAVEAGTGVRAALRDAWRAVLTAAAVGTVAGGLLALLEARVRSGERGVRAARVAGFAALALLVAGAGAAAARNADRIGDVAQKHKRLWEDPSERYDGAEDGVLVEESAGSRLTSANPLQRYEYWQVALEAFGERPVAGLGAGGFEHRYTTVRAFSKYASFPHSLLMRVLVEGGLLGLLGVLAFVGAVLWTLLRRLGAQDGPTRTVVAGALSAAVLFALHAQIDWIEEFPALAAPALAFLVVAMVVRGGRDETEPAAAGAAARYAAGALVAVVAALSLAPPYMAVRYGEHASAVWRSDSAAAYRSLDRAAALNPLDDTPRLLEGTIALQREDLPRARRAFEAALEREPGWLAHFEIALILGAQRDLQAATRQLALAEALNPKEPAISAVREEIRAGKVIDPVRLNRLLFESPLFKGKRLT